MHTLLLLLFVLLPGIQNLRVKRQFNSPSYHLQQWEFDQVSYQRPYGYQQQTSYEHAPAYYNYYQQRYVTPHQAPSGWNVNSNEHSSYYSYPYNPYYSHQSSGYATAPPVRSSGSSYGRPPIIRDQEIVYSQNNVKTSSEPQDAYPTAPTNWEGSLNANYPVQSPTEETTTIQSGFGGSNFDSRFSGTFLARSPENEGGNQDKHGVEIAKEDAPKTDEFSMKSVGDDGTDSDINRKLAAGNPTEAEELPNEIPSTTLGPIDEKLKSVTDDKTTSDVVVEIMGTTPASVTAYPPEKDGPPLYIDAEDSSSSSTPPYPGAEDDVSSTTARPLGDSTIPMDEYVPTEVLPAATPQSEPETTTTAINDSSTSSNPDDKVILRSPPLPKEVAEKLKELGFSVLKLT
ncbi:hypothetical protein RB195_026069 [Necator americanus]|uniref:Uncharacterized protein n=1 Tax=Necator americanus TaxID=51031 RepID=A0ABR1EVG3_NECAM